MDAEAGHAGHVGGAEWGVMQFIREFIRDLCFLDGGIGAAGSSVDLLQRAECGAGSAGKSEGGEVGAVPI